MQRFDRSSEPPPVLLQSKEFILQRQAMFKYFKLEEQRRAQTRVPNLHVELNHDSINSALKRLFHDKCAFCESYATTEPYRFRPAGSVLPMAKRADSRLYYIWLSAAWENLYPICQLCRPERPEYFPVKGTRAVLPSTAQLERYVAEGIGLWRDHPPKESNVLLDPCKDNFVPHFTSDLYGYLFPHTDRAQQTIDQFNLNRQDLLEVRAQRLREYFDELVEWILRGHRPSRDSSELFNFSELEFGGSWYLMCRQIILFINEGSPKQWSLSLTQIEQTFQRLTTSSLKSFNQDALEEWVNDSLRGSFTSDSHLMRVLTETPPTLTSISLTDFKGIEQLELEIPEAKASTAELPNPLQPALLILGENATGKSSILEAVALALSTDEARAELKLDVSALPLDPKLMGEHSAPQREKATVSLKFDDGSTRSLTIEGGRFLMEAEPDVPPVFAYGAFRQYQKRTKRYSHGKSILSLFHPDKPLSNPEKWLLSLGSYQFQEVVGALRVILSIEGDFDVMERDYENNRCLIVTSSPGNRVSNRTPLGLASSGYRSVLAMVCDIIQGLMSAKIHTFYESLETARAVVLIDEVEAHLHPRWKIQIMKALRIALPKVTFIVTTHDPLCLRGMEDGEVIVMQRVPSQNGADSEWPVMVEQVVRLPDVSQLTIEQLLTSDFFGLASTDQPRIERELAMFADLLLARATGQSLTEDQQLAWERFEQDVSDALPVGTTEVQRLVQEAVSDYLKNRRQMSSENLGKLRDQARREIVTILEAL